VDYCIVVRAEQDIFLDPEMSPDMSCENYREELLVGNRLRLLGWSPGASKPVALHVRSIADRACNIGRHFNISLGQQSWEEPEANTMPILQELVPP